MTVIATTSEGIDYDPQGNAIAGVPPEQGYIRKEVDRESGLGDYSARKYDGEDGEFPTADEWWERYRSTSPYVYSFDNPVRQRDPSGRGNGRPEPELETMPPEMGTGGGWGGGGGEIEPGAAAEGLAEEAVEKAEAELGQIFEIRVTPTAGEAASTKRTGAIYERMEQQSAVKSTLPKDPNDLLKQGYKKTSYPDAAKAGHRTFENPDTGDKVRYDQGKAGAPGYEGQDHYHRYNPNSTGKGDQYLDKDGKPVPKGSGPSHLPPGELYFW